MPFTKILTIHPPAWCIFPPHVEPSVCLHSGIPNVSSFYRWLGEAPTQRAKEKEQAEASVSGPEPAQRPFGLCTQQSVRTEPADFPLKKKRRKNNAKLLAATAATIFWLTWTVPNPSHHTSPRCPPGHSYTITIKKILCIIPVSAHYTHASRLLLPVPLLWSALGSLSPAPCLANWSHFPSLTLLLFCALMEDEGITRDCGGRRAEWTDG